MVIIDLCREKIPLEKKCFYFFCSIFIISSYLRSLNKKVDDVEPTFVNKTVYENFSGD